jgi:hypothetical protein
MLSALRRMSIHATDGDIGAVHDVFFDDAAWVIRYLVVDTRRWLPGRKVLISPFAVRRVDWEKEFVEVSITRDQVKGSPDVDTDKPVSRQHESAHLLYYGYPFYWGGTMAWGGMDTPNWVPPLTDAVDRAELHRKEIEQGDPHLRSCNTVTSYQIEAADGSIGHVDDLLHDEQNWSVRYLVVDTRDWLPGRRVLVATDWVTDVSWDKRSVQVDLTREQVRESPEWDPDQLFTPDDERSLYQHYGRNVGNRGAAIR